MKNENDIKEWFNEEYPNNMNEQLFTLYFNTYSTLSSYKILDLYDVLSLNDSIPITFNHFLIVLCILAACDSIRLSEYFQLISDKIFDILYQYNQYNQANIYQIYQTYIPTLKGAQHYYTEDTNKKDNKLSINISTIEDNISIINTVNIDTKVVKKKNDHLKTINIETFKLIARICGLDEKQLNNILNINLIHHDDRIDYKLFIKMYIQIFTQWDRWKLAHQNNFHIKKKFNTNKSKKNLLCDHCLSIPKCTII